MDYILVESFTVSIMNVEYARRWYHGGENDRRMESAGERK